MSQALALDYAYRYPFPSRLVGEGNGRRLSLATSGGAEPNPYFFRGRLWNPSWWLHSCFCCQKSAGRAITRPNHMHLPVICCRRCGSGCHQWRGAPPPGSVLVCCGVYGRIDNVARLCRRRLGRQRNNQCRFHVPMRDVLSSVGGTRRRLAQCRSRPTRIERAGEKTVEKKVSLPDRWLKGFVEVQAYQSRMKPFMEISGQQAHEFLHSISDPTRVAKGQINYIVPMGKVLD